MKFTIGKYKTRDGCDAEVLKVVEGQEEALIGCVTHEDGSVSALSWKESGEYVLDGLSGYDLILPLFEGWMNEYPDGICVIHQNEDEAEILKANGCRRTFKVREVRDED